MNQIQKKIFLTTVAVITTMGLFPPWHIISARGERPIGYDFIAHPPHDYAAINITTLLVQIVIAALLGSALLYYCKNQD